MNCGEARRDKTRQDKAKAGLTDTMRKRRKKASCFYSPQKNFKGSFISKCSFLHLDVVVGSHNITAQVEYIMAKVGGISSWWVVVLVRYNSTSCV